MNTPRPHITDLFKRFASVRQKRLSKGEFGKQNPGDGLEQMLACYSLKSDVCILRPALLDPYFPLGMLARTMFADVVGMRFYINKRRRDLEPELAAELVAWAAAFLQIRHDIEKIFNPETITCIPVDGSRHPLPSGQWCTLCGVCCQIGGVPPQQPPPDIHYPDYWHNFLSGKTLENQQLCPFLFQYFGEPRFFCAIHNIKPLACRQFDKKDCRRRLEDVNLHA